MNLLVYPHDLYLGGSETNAIELAAGVRDLGHDVTVVARTGPLMEIIERLGLSFIQLDRPTESLAFRTKVRRLRRVIREGRYDVIHAYEFKACLEAQAALGFLTSPSLLATEMSMVVPRRFPKTVPLIMGTEALGIEAERRGVRRVFTMVPPVDIEKNHPSVDGRDFLKEHDLSDSALKVLVVSRLDRELKREGIERTIDAVAMLSQDFRMQLVVVGSGQCYEYFEERARQVNAEVGRRTVILTGPKTDPRPAYATADVVVGMGHSILRGMAFGKPAIVVGERGFSEIVSPASIDRFRHVGFYSLGSGGDDHSRLREQLAELLASEPRRRELGLFSRGIVRDEHALSAGALKLEEIYRQLGSRRPIDGARLRETADLTFTLARSKARRIRAGMTRLPASQGGAL